MGSQRDVKISACMGLVSNKKHADYEYAILPIYILMAEIVFSKKEIDKFAFIIKLLLTWHYAPARTI